MNANSQMTIADYGLIGDCRTAALVGKNGSVDWLCWPRFDSASCFAALLGSDEHGMWSIGPADGSCQSSRSYIEDTIVLETVFTTNAGSFAVIDFMPMDQNDSSLIRIVEGRTGCVMVHMNLSLRFDYGTSVPWVTRLRNHTEIVAIAGPNLIVLRTSVPLHGKDLSTRSTFEINERQRIAFVMTYGASHRDEPMPVDANAALDHTLAYWKQWSAQCDYTGHRRDAVVRSLLTLKALTFAETGGIVAAPTTSLPEQIGGSRNWDYRYCWVRDATLTLIALMGAGYFDEARAWRNWLHRAVAGSPEAIQIMYGIAGERRLDEWEIPWLPGYRNSRPVRIGNAASGQLQLDVFGEMTDALHLAREGDLAPLPSGWSMQCKALEHLETIWQDPDDGIWEVRGGRKQFTHSKVMAWVAFDRTIRDAEQYGLDAPIDRWRIVRDDIHRTVCDMGYSQKQGTFTQSFDNNDLDASLLLIPTVGFLPIDDPRITRTITAIENNLISNGFVLRYRTERGTDGLPPGEGVFLACSFWLADVYQLQRRFSDADRLIDRLLALRNELGLLSEEYDTVTRSLVGNFPQAFSHLAMVRTILSQHRKQPLRSCMKTDRPRPLRQRPF